MIREMCSSSQAANIAAVANKPQLSTLLISPLNRFSKIKHWNSSWKCCRHEKNQLFANRDSLCMSFKNIFWRMFLHFAHKSLKIHDLSKRDSSSPCYFQCWISSQVSSCSIFLTPAWFSALGITFFCLTAEVVITDTPIKFHLEQSLRLTNWGIWSARSPHMERLCCACSLC